MITVIIIMVMVMVMVMSCPQECCFLARKLQGETEERVGLWGGRAHGAYFREEGGVTACFWEYTVGCKGFRLALALTYLSRRAKLMMVMMDGRPRLSPAGDVFSHAYVRPRDRTHCRAVADQDAAHRLPAGGVRLGSHSGRPRGEARDDQDDRR